MTIIGPNVRGGEKTVLSWTRRAAGETFAALLLCPLSSQGTAASLQSLRCARASTGWGMSLDNPESRTAAQQPETHMNLTTNPDTEGQSDAVTGSMQVNEWQSGHVDISIQCMTDDAIAALLDVLQQHLQQGPALH